MNLFRTLIHEICGTAGTDIDDIMGTAQLAHLGQKRRTGESYLEHPKEVARIVDGYYGDSALCAAALLHDTLEDAIKQGNFKSEKELETMILASFDDDAIGREVLRVVKKLTHSKGVTYHDYVLSLLTDPSALRVKLSDMLHNLRSKPTDRQLIKYARTLQALQKASKGIPYGINKGHWNELQNAVSSVSLNEIYLRRAIRYILKEEKENWSEHNKIS
jgi:(p)ppGpp synthase/HD superfamily hydrolase